MTDVHNDTLEDEDFDTILSADIEFSGKLNFDKPFLIRGKVTGEIAAKNLLVIDEGAVVEANIAGTRVVIRGSVKGDITALERLEITVNGRLAGDVLTPDISMESGCNFNGQCTMPEKNG